MTESLESRPSPLESLVETLGAGFDFDAIALMDALWVARLMPPSEAVTQSDKSVVTLVRGDFSVEAPQPNSDTKEQSAKSSSEIDIPLIPPAGAVYPDSELPTEGEPYIPARALRIPAGAALPQGLELVRALRALPKRVPSRTEIELDEEATVDATAQSWGRLTTVLRPRLERWFDAALVVEQTPSMEIWSQTVVEIERILQYSGVFRDVRTYWLHAGARPYLVRQCGTTATLGSLQDPVARRLILLFSAGVSPNWSDGTIGLTVKLLGQTNPVVLVHAMPHHLWKSTVLGEPNAVVSNMTPGGPNAELRSQRVAWARRIPLSGPRSLLPVFALERHSVQSWVDMFMSRRGGAAPAFLVRTKRTSVQPGVSILPELTAEERVSLFKSGISPEAFRLAVHLAAGPITMPIIHLIQSSLLGGSARQSQIAEVMLSGLVERITPLGSKMPPEKVKVQFEATARAILLKSLRRDDARRLAVLLQDYVEREFGSSNDILISVPDPTGKLSIPASAEPFAQLRSGFLEFLGVRSLPADFKLRQGVTTATRVAHEDEQGPEVQIDSSSSVEPADTKSRLSGEKILWVDDNPKNNSVESAYLRDELGATIVTALTTDKALSALQGSRYDLIISDMGRGHEKEAGLDLLRRVQTEHFNLPIIIYTASWAKTGREIATSAGAFGCTNLSDELFQLVIGAAESMRTVRGAFAGRMRLALRGLGFDPPLSDNLFEARPDELANEIAKRSKGKSELQDYFVTFLNLVTNCGYVQLFLVSGGSIRLAVQRSDIGRNTYQTASPDGIIGLAVASRKSVYVPDVRKHERYIAAERSTKSEFAVPILNHNGETAAVVNLESPIMAAFSTVQVRWVEDFVKHFPLEHQLQGDDDEKDYEYLGTRAFEREAFEESIALYSRAIAVEPKKASLYRERGSAYWYAQLYAEAVEDLTAALYLDPAFESDVRTNRGQVYAEMGRFQEALEELDFAVPRLEKENRLVYSAYALRARGVANAGLGKTEDAYADLELSRQRAPNNAWLWYSIARVYENEGRTDQALEWYLTAIVTTEPKLSPLNLVDVEKSVARLLALKRSGSQDTTEVGTEEEQLIEIGKAALQSNKFAVALGAYSAAILKQPSKPNNYLFRAQAYRKASMNDAAKRDLKTLMESQPNSLLEAFTERGEIYMDEKEFTNAGSDFAHALEIAERERKTNDIALIHSKLSLLHLRSGDPSAALDEISISLSLQPDSGQFLSIRGQIYENTGRLGDAWSDYEAAISSAEDSLDPGERAKLSARMEKPPTQRLA